MIILYLLASYVAFGLATAIAFVCLGIPRVMGGPVPLTVGARLILVPGAMALWPLVLKRWLAARAQA